MFLALSLLLLGWQACNAVPRDVYPFRGDVYPFRGDVYPFRGDVYPFRSDIIVPRSVQFTNDFSFGVSTSAYQIEGAWNKDGKGENIWDRLLHTHPSYANGSNGDVAARGYYKMEEDIDLLNFLNVGHYRMSLSWSRLLPNGLITYVNPSAVDHYQKQFRLLRQNNIEPIVTLYHWDLPQRLQDMGGFQNESMVSWFSDYARVAFDLFGDDVKYWSTFNEPYEICANGYGNGGLAPAINKSGVADYICGHNLLKAHAAAYHVYDKEFRSDQGGLVSITIGSEWIEPATNSQDDILAAETLRQFTIGWFANPIYNGGYPPVMKERVRERSALQGLPTPRLPKFTKDEIKNIKGTHDFFSLNSYGTLHAKSQESPLLPVSLQNDIGAKLTIKKEFQEDTHGIRKILVWVKENYNDPSILITESGFRSNSATLEDTDRIRYMKKTLNNVFDAKTLDGVNVYGYTVWSLMDSFEWNSGYRVKYGLYAVDFKDPERARTPRKSALWYKQVATTGCTGEICPRYDGY